MELHFAHHTQNAHGAARAFFVLPLPLADNVLNLAARGSEGIRDCDVYVFVAAGSTRVAAYQDVIDARNGDVQADAVLISMSVAMLRAANNNPSGRDAIIKLFEFFRLVANALCDVVYGFDVLECNLEGHLHVLFSLKNVSILDVSKESLLRSPVLGWAIQRFYAFRPTKPFAVYLAADSSRCRRTKLFEH